MMKFSRGRGTKEAFVSDLTGSSMEDVVCVTLLPSVLVVLHSCVMYVWTSVCGGWCQHGVVRGILECMVLVVPQILQVTLSDEHHMVLGVSAGLTAGFLIVFSLVAWYHTSRCTMVRGAAPQPPRSSTSSTPLPPPTPHDDDNDDDDNADRSKSMDRQPESSIQAWRPDAMKMIQDSVSLHRANVMVMTCLAILAVDFPIFPRKYAKTELYGTSLMDAGVGSIVLCSAYAEGMKQMQSTRYRTTRKNRMLLKESSFSSLMRVFMLIVLGVGRPVALFLIGYHVHVGEYGMHWNFFLTLAVVRACMSNVPRSVSPFALGGALLCAHQYGLSRMGLEAIANAQPSLEDRQSMNLLYQNKEGIISLPGYLALHFLGVWCAKLHIWLISKPRIALMRGWNMLQVSVVGLLWSLYYYYTNTAYFGQEASRRTCNTAFVLWMLAINLQAIVLNTLCLNIIAFLGNQRGEACIPEQRRIASPYIPPLLNSVNKGMLYVFLLSNVLTGIVNSTINTLDVDAMVARCILMAYMGLVCLCTRVFFPSR